MKCDSSYTFSHKGESFRLNLETLSSVIIDPELPNPSESDSKRSGTYDNFGRAERTSDTLIKKIALNVAQKCNLGCVYCFAGDGSYGNAGTMNEYTAFRSVDWLIEQSQDEPNIAISFFGGEPLLNFSLIKKVVPYARENANKANKKVSFNIVTNGTLLDDKNIHYFKENGVVVHVSFDGPKEIQDLQRPFKNGKGSYDATLPRLKKLLSALPESRCHAVVYDSSDIEQLRESLTAIGFSELHFMVPSTLSAEMPSASKGPTSGEELPKCNGQALGTYLGSNAAQKIPEVQVSTLDQQGVADRDHKDMMLRLETMADDLLAYIQQRDLRYFDKFARPYIRNRYRRMLKQMITGTKIHFPDCGAGRKFMAVSCEGQVYPCHRFVGMEELTVGDVENGTLDRDPYVEGDAEICDECKGCHAKYFCAGGCYYENFSATGSAFEPDTEYCRLMKRMTELVAATYARLTHEEKNFVIDGLNAVAIEAEKPSCPLDMF